MFLCSRNTFAMKKILLSTLSFFLFVFIFSNQASAQTKDSVVFDYDAYASCKACNDNIAYNVGGTKDSLTDATPSTKYISAIKVKIKLFTCYTATPLTLWLNGNAIATINSSYLCSCNACDSLIFNLSAAQVAAYYKYGQKNVFKLTSLNSGGLYIDRTVIYRTLFNKMNYDAGITSVDSPGLYVCAGTRNIKIKAANFGKKQFSSLSVDWKWNNTAQTTVNYSASTLDTLNGSGSNTAVISLGAKTFTKGKKDTLIAWTKNPGGVIDSVNGNDTIRYIFSGSYSDTLRVGGTSPDFSTIQAAVNALMSSGICSPTFVKIRPSTYNEQISIGPIPGASSTNTVTFLSSNGDSSSVVINYTANSTNNYTIRLINASHILFRKLTIEALHSTYGRVFSLEGNLENIQFMNCALLGVSTTSTSSSRAIVYRYTTTPSDKTNAIIFSQTALRYGSYGLSFENGYSNYGNGFYIRNCHFDNQYYMNLNVYYAKNVGISGSLFERAAASVYYGYGLRLQQVSDTLNFSNNRIFQKGGGYGLYLSSVYGTSSKRSLIANNFISVVSPVSYSSDMCLQSSYCEYVDIVNNSMYRYTQLPDYAALYVEGGYKQRILNNCVHNAYLGKVFQIISSSSNAIEKSDRNNFYNGGSVLGTFFGKNISVIGDIKTKVGQDSNSVSSNPNYTGQYDLHAYSVDMDGNAKPHPGVGKDIDGKTRNSTKPDIGATEFKLAALDAGISEIKPTLAGTQCLKAVIRNMGNTTITSAKIDWIVNGTAKTQVSWTGSLAKGDTDIVCLGTMSFTSGTAYTAKIWTSAPNSGTDSLKSNDTLYSTFYPAMRGEYTIGGTTPDFSTFSAAVTAVENAGIIDSVYFKVRNGTYTEQIEINRIKGASAFNSVIFESESKDSTKVILKYTSAGYSNNYVVWLNGVQGVSFRRIRLQNVSSSYKRVVNVSGGSENINFKNNIIENNDSTSTSSYSMLFYLESNFGNSLNIQDNVFNLGSYGLYLYGAYTIREENINIKNNQFNRQAYIPVYLGYIANFEVSGNRVIANNSSVYAGMLINDIGGSGQIFNNKIDINNLYGDYGISIEYYESTDTLKVYNNFVSLSSAESGVGIYAYNLDNVKFYYNNVLNECTDSSDYSSAFSIYYSNATVYNNNFVHLKNGYAYYVGYNYAYTSNFNNLHSNGTKYVYWDGSTYTTLAAYRAARARDTNSVDVNPLYASFSDLHTSSVGIDGKGRTIYGITKDIDGDTRNTTKPDIGADEFTPPTLDAGVTKLLSPGEFFKATSLPIKLVVTNHGIDTLKKVTIHVKINKDTLSRKTITKTLKSGDTAHVNMGNFLFKTDSIYNLYAWTSNPNGSADQKTSNDTLKFLSKMAALSGVYTIGGTSPDFASFKAALAALKKAGMVDSVRFRVRSGTYTEQLRIPAIGGAGKRNSIIFESESFDSTAVTLQYSSAYYDSNYVVQLQGADGITFRYMTLKANGGTYNTVFNISGRAINNTIYKNILFNNSTTSTDTRNALIYSSYDADDYLHIKNNIFKNGSYGVYLNGYPSSPPYNYENGIFIADNRMQNPYYMGIYLEYGDSSTISGNIINLKGYLYSYAIYVNYLLYHNVNANRLYLNPGYMGMYNYECGTSSTRSLVSNNTLYLKNSSTNPYGFYVYYTDYTDFIHNSINIDNGLEGTDAYFIYGSSNTLYNNIFSNLTTGRCLYFNSSSTITNSNRNDLFAKGSILGYYNGSNYANLSAWQAGTQKDTHSISIDPLFKAVDNLRAKEVTLNGAAKFFKSVKYDFEGDLRDTLKPDIGADEFNLPPNDAGIVKILLPSIPFKSDTQQVKVVLKNYGGNTLYVASIGWKLNNVTQTTYSWSGTLASGDTTHVKLGKKYFDPDTAYSMIAWTSNPNGTGDSITTNDTSKVKDQYPALSGIYTIGGASPDFANFTDAVTALKRGGIIDTVRFDVRSGTYSEQIIIPAIAGAEDEGDIIFQSELKDSSKVILIGSASSSANYVVRLDHTKGITFRYLTIKTVKNYGYNKIIEILGTSKNINIHDNHLIGYTGTTSTNESNIYIYNSNSSVAAYDNIEVYRNRFESGSYGIYVYGYSSLGYGKNLNIHHNNMEDQYYSGIEVDYSFNTKIEKNNIYHTSAAASSSAIGVYLYYCQDGFEMNGNNIYNQESYGIYCYQADGKVQDTSLISNNFIHTRRNATVYGMYIYLCDYLNIFNNNVHNPSTTANSYAAYIYSPSVISVFNNNFVSSGGGYAIYLNGTLTKSDYNNLYTTGTNLGQHNSVNKTNLAAWRTSTSRDAKSLSIDPDYVSATDLHVRETDLNAAGRNHKYLIKIDFDDEKRDSISPDIGADEFKIPAGKDAGIASHLEPIVPFVAGTRSVKVSLKNYGSDTLKSVTIHWKVNGTSQSSYSWTGALKTGQSQTVTIGTFNFISGIKHDMVFWTTSPNGGTDSANYNDTAFKKNLYSALDGVYTVSGILPDFANLADAFAALNLGGNSDTVWFKIRSGSYAAEHIIQPYPGSHPSRPVYIEAETGDSSDVVLVNTGTNSQIVYIKGADYLRFRKLTFRPNYAYGYSAVRFDNGSSGLGFENCHFDLSNAATSYTYYSHYGLYSPSDKDDSTTVKNCRFDKGTYGFYCYSGSGNEKLISVLNNVFTNQASYALYMQYSDAPRIRYNTLNSSISSNYAMAIYYSGLDLILSHNKIHNSGSGADGIYLYNHTSSSASKANIYNNFIAVNGASAGSIALNIISSAYVNVFHNSLNVYGSNTASSALNLQSGSNHDIRNNNFINMGGGYALKYISSPSISQSNYNNIYTPGTYIGNHNGSDKTALSDWKTATSKEVNSLSLNPIYTSDYDLHTNLSSLDSACLYISTVTDDIDLEARNTSKSDIGADEFQSLPENLGVSAFVNPTHACGLDSTLIKVKVFNYGNKAQVNFPIRYSFNGGTIKSATFTDTLKPGKELVYQFTAKEPISINNTYSVKAWTDLTNEKFRANDSLKIVFTNYQKPDSVKNMVPTDGTTGVDYPVSLSWVPSTGATKYDVYVWLFGTSRPSTPSLANTTQISYQINSGLTYGEKYNWQVEAKNPVCNTAGKVQTFTMKHLPDLIVESVSSPKTAFSGKSISVSWKVKNTGLGSASGGWWDALFLSNDAILDVTDQYLGATQNPAALNASQNYTQSLSVALPNGITGNYYIFVKTDYYGGVHEADDGNNSTRDTAKMAVSLTPPPDLQVVSVTRPATAFSGSPYNTTFVVKNKGTGATLSGAWYDKVYLSTEKVLNGSSYYLAQKYHTGNLNVDSTYQVTLSITIPNFISGKYFLVVQTDANNHEYEHASESNNTTGSDTVKVILTPPPDLIVSSVAGPDTVSNSESMLIKYNIINEGGSETFNGFHDKVVLSPTSTYNVSTAIFLDHIYHGNLGSKDTSKVSKYFTVPKSIKGKYYLFILTDFYNGVNEVSNEGNNSSTAWPIFIKSPDLRVSRVAVSAVDTTGSNTPVNWTVKNAGPGHDYQGNRTDSIYISKVATWSRSSSTPVGILRYSATILNGDTLARSTEVRIPDGFDGTRYFYVMTDAAKEVYEVTETDNHNRSNSMNVTLAPYPDLVPQITAFPDSSKAGNLISITYKVLNDGEAKANPSWKDKFYVSKDSIFSFSKVSELTVVSRSSVLEKDSTYSATVNTYLPASMSKGKYYYHVFTDVELKVYEHTNDSNNHVGTKRVFIDGYPPVDLKVSCPTLADTLYSGKSHTLTYMVTNIGQAKTAVSSWNDGIYLSTDSFFSSSDVKIGEVPISKALEKDSTYKVTKALLIPNGTEGKYYVLVKADIGRLIKDVDTTNNVRSVCKTSGGSKRIVINLTPPPDLRITLWNIPSTATSGQPIKLSWKVENKGNGSTVSGSWKDQCYLSTDNVIDHMDYFLGERRHTGNLAVNGYYTDTQSFSIPLDKVGNYILIIKTDGANEEYEHTNEGNNLVSAVTSITKAPPADLIVSEVTAPDSVVSGSSIGVTWKVKNKGSNPATGTMRDNIYLSTDTKQDASDLLLHSEIRGISLAPNSEISASETILVSGIALGDYYVLVSTDVLNNVNESNDTNNTKVATNKLNVNVPILPLDVKKKDTLNNGEKIYYRIIIPSTLAGESLLITLKADSVKGNNEIFVRFNEMVTGSQFDYKYREPFKGNQEIIIPELKEGTYYLLTTGQKTGTPTYQPITLYARIMPFEIRKVSPVAGGNTGEVTLLIEGSKLDGANFSIINSAFGASILPDTGRYYFSGSVPLSSEVIDPTVVYSTFNLRGYELGEYDILGEKDLENTMLPKGFKVEAGGSEEIDVSMVRPGNQRSNAVLSMTVVFTNKGNTDAVNQKLLITSNAGAPIAFTDADLSKNYSALEITMQEENGPPGRLRPGGSGSVTIYTKSSGALGFTILK